MKKVLLVILAWIVYFNITSAISSSDKMRTLQSFNVVGDGIADDTMSLSMALNSGDPLYCRGTMRITSLITITSKDVGMFATNASSCVIRLTTSTSSIYFNESPTNKITIQNLTIIPEATITSSGSPNTAAIDIEFPLGGTNNGPLTSVNLKNIFIVPDEAGHYTTSGIYLYNTNVTKVDDVYEGGDSGFYRAATNGIVYDTNNSGSVFTSHNLFFTDVANGVLIPPQAAHGPQGIRIYDLDCVYCNVGVNATGGGDGLSDQIVVQGAEGAVQTAGVSINNFSHASVTNNYWFLINSNLANSPTPANPSCYILAWNLAVPINGAANSLAPGNTCDGVQMTTFTGSRIGVYLIGTSNTNMASMVGTQTLTNLDIGVQISPNTGGWAIEKQATKNVSLEVSNLGAAGANSQSGEILRSSVPYDSAVNLISTITKTITSVKLSPGNWLCSGNIAFNPNAATTITVLEGAMSTVAGAMPALGDGSAFFLGASFLPGIGTSISLSMFKNVTSLTPLYIIASSNFAGGTQSAYGTIECHRL